MSSHPAEPDQVSSQAQNQEGGPWSSHSVGQGATLGPGELEKCKAVTDIPS